MKRTKPRRHRGPVAARVAEPGPAASREPVPARDRRTWLIAIPLVLLVATAFFPAVDNPFVAWDDDLNFLGNADYRGLGWPQVRWAGTNFKAGVYQPMAWLAFEAQYVLFGLDPRGYHLTSLLLHAAVAVCFYALAVALLVRCRPDPFLGSPWARTVGAGLAAALFAVHPLQVEAVAWASCQPYLLCACSACWRSWLTSTPSGRGRRGGDGGPARSCCSPRRCCRRLRRWPCPRSWCSSTSTRSGDWGDGPGDGSAPRRTGLAG